MFSRSVAFKVFQSFLAGASLQRECRGYGHRLTSQQTSLQVLLPAVATPAPDHAGARRTGLADKETG
jgi:hypothetical protein